MTLFNDLYEWADENSEHRVQSSMACVYDKANREEQQEQSPDFAAASNGVFDLNRAGVLQADFYMTFVGPGWQPGNRRIWRTRLQRNGGIDLFQDGWTGGQFVSLSGVERVDRGSGDFAIGFLQNRSTRALLSFSFDRIINPFPH